MRLKKIKAMTHATPDINKTLPSLLTVKEIASFLRVDYQVIRSLVYSGQLPAFKVGKQWRVTRDNLSKYINTNINTNLNTTD